MRTLALFLATAVSLGAGVARAAPPRRIVHPTPAELIAAAKAAPMEAFSAGGATCGQSCTAERWLARLTRPQGAAIRWSARPCRFRDEENAPEGRGRACVQAVVLIRGYSGPPPLVEVDLAGSRGGRPGQPYALRGVIEASDGEDYALTPEDFESAWIGRFQR